MTQILPFIKPHRPRKLRRKGGLGMHPQGLWRLFLRTGLPQAYALYRRLARPEEAGRRGRKTA